MKRGKKKVNRIRRRTRKKGKDAQGSTNITVAPPPLPPATTITKFPSPSSSPILPSYSSCSSASSHCRPEQRAANTGASIFSATTTTPPTAMPEYKLIYFNGRGLAELSRWIMHYGNIPFTDDRFEHDDWPERKKNITGGKVPVLEVDGKTLPQSLAIARFLAKKAGLMPEDPLQAAFCDAVAETARDMIMEIFRVLNAEGKSEEENLKNLNEDYIPNTLMPTFQRLEKRFTEKDWFIGDKVSWADLAIARTVERVLMDPIMAHLATKLPKMKAHTDRVKNLPGIKEWIEKRPDTPF